MALFKPRKPIGPRAVREWIGDVYVVDEWSAARKFYDSARAVWVGAGGPALARARRATCSEDEMRVALTASRAHASGLVETWVTYRQDDELFIVEHDAADITLRELMEALGEERDALPFGLVEHVARAAITAVRAVPVSFDPDHIDVAWDGRVLFRPAHPAELVPDEDEGAYDVLRLAYGAERPWRALASVLYELITGAHPFGDVVQYEQEAYVAMRERMLRDEFEPLPVRVPERMKSFIERHLTLRGRDALPLQRDGDRDASSDADAFNDADVVHMLRGLFAEKQRACALEREERLLVAPPRVRQERWALFEEEDD